MGRHCTDLTGKVFGMLLIIKRGPNARRGSSQWHAVCECGNKLLIMQHNLVKGDHKSCGCATTQHGYARRGRAMRVEYIMWATAKITAAKENLPFSIHPTDIHIPKRCPLLGIKLKSHRKKASENSPSLDKIVPKKGYVKGNIWVVSLRANRMKSDFTVELLESFAKKIRKRLKQW